MAHPGMAGPSVGSVRLKRTRHVRNYYHTMPRMAYSCLKCGHKVIIVVKSKVSQVKMEVLPGKTGEIERGRVDGDE